MLLFFLIQLVFSVTHTYEGSKPLELALDENFVLYECFLYDFISVTAIIFKGEGIAYMTGCTLSNITGETSVAFEIGDKVLIKFHYNCLGKIIASGQGAIMNCVVSYTPKDPKITAHKLHYLSACFCEAKDFILSIEQKNAKLNFEMKQSNYSNNIYTSEHDQICGYYVVGFYFDIYECAFAYNSGTSGIIMLKKGTDRYSTFHNCIFESNVMSDQSSKGLLYVDNVQIIIEILAYRNNTITDSAYHIYAIGDKSIRIGNIYVESDFKFGSDGSLKTQMYGKVDSYKSIQMTHFQTRGVCFANKPLPLRTPNITPSVTENIPVVPPPEEKPGEDEEDGEPEVKPPEEDEDQDKPEVVPPGEKPEEDEEKPEIKPPEEKPGEDEEKPEIQPPEEKPEEDENDGKPEIKPPEEDEDKDEPETNPPPEENPDGDDNKPDGQPPEDKPEGDNDDNEPDPKPPSEEDGDKPPIEVDPDQDNDKEEDTNQGDSSETSETLDKDNEFFEKNTNTQEVNSFSKRTMWIIIGICLALLLLILACILFWIIYKRSKDDSSDNLSDDYILAR